MGKHPDEEKKTELAVDILEDKLKVYEGKIPGNSITLITDTTYAVKRALTPAREKGLIYVGKLKKDRQIRLFSMWMQVEEYFGKYKKERYLTHGRVKVFHKQANYVKELGRVKVRRLREENESEPKYYVSHHLALFQLCLKMQKV